ncbi:MAG: hypothetical protein NVSMB4_04280 [Acidimicrobiales bacterium]
MTATLAMWREPFPPPPDDVGWEAPYCAAVPDFLSPDWMALVEAEAGPVDPDVAFRLAQTVTDTPSGDVTYLVEISGGCLHIRVGRGESDAALTLPYTAAVSLAVGEETVHDAVLRGDVKVSGNLEKLQAATSCLVALRDSMGRVRSRTSFPGRR